MTFPLPYPIHTIADVGTQIAQGEDPWFALGNFFHDWWCYAIDVRADLIAEPPTIGTTLEEKRWGAFCAAAVEELCKRTAFPCPLWVNNPEYLLEDPWWYYPQPSQREWLKATTPEAFQRHNVFVGGSVLDNKYELREQLGSQAKWTAWTDEELHRLVRAKEQSNSST